MNLNFVNTFNKYIDIKNEIYTLSQFNSLKKLHSFEADNELEDLCMNYDNESLNSFTILKILSPQERVITDDGYIIFGENLHGNFYYVSNSTYTNFFCVDFEGEYLWDICNSIESFFTVFTVLLEMESERIKSEEKELTKVRKNFYLQKLTSLIETSEESSEFLNYFFD